VSCAPSSPSSLPLCPPSSQFRLPLHLYCDISPPFVGYAVPPAEGPPFLTFFNCTLPSRCLSFFLMRFCDLRRSIIASPFYSMLDSLLTSFLFIVRSRFWDSLFFCLKPYFQFFFWPLLKAFLAAGWFLCFSSLIQALPSDLFSPSLFLS